MTSQQATSESAPLTGSTTNVNADSCKSALQDNIERKGKNAYYFAHSHKATGPKWDGKAEPRLLSSNAVNLGILKRSASAFDYAKSNITSYSFLDEPSKVKLFIDLKDVGELCTDDDIQLEYTEHSFCLTVNNYKQGETPPCLCFGRLTGPITGASFKRKDHKVVLTLMKKEQDVEWYTINSKGTPDHEVV